MALHNKLDSVEYYRQRLEKTTLIYATAGAHHELMDALADIHNDLSAATKLIEEEKIHPQELTKTILATKETLIARSTSIVNNLDKLTQPNLKHADINFMIARTRLILLNSFIETLIKLNDHDSLLKFINSIQFDQFIMILNKISSQLALFLLQKYWHTLQGKQQNELLNKIGPKLVCKTFSYQPNTQLAIAILQNIQFVQRMRKNQLTKLVQLASNEIFLSIFHHHEIINKVEHKITVALNQWFHQHARLINFIELIYMLTEEDKSSLTEINLTKCIQEYLHSYDAHTQYFTSPATLNKLPRQIRTIIITALNYRKNNDTRILENATTLALDLTYCIESFIRISNKNTKLINMLIIDNLLPFKIPLSMLYMIITGKKSSPLHIIFAAKDERQSLKKHVFTRNFLLTFTLSSTHLFSTPQTEQQLQQLVAITDDAIIKSALHALWTMNPSLQKDNKLIKLAKVILKKYHRNGTDNAAAKIMILINDVTYRRGMLTHYLSGELNIYLRPQDHHYLATLALNEFLIAIKEGSAIQTKSNGFSSSFNGVTIRKLLNLIAQHDWRVSHRIVDDALTISQAVLNGDTANTYIVLLQSILEDANNLDYLSVSQFKIIIHKIGKLIKDKSLFGRDKKMKFILSSLGYQARSFYNKMIELGSALGIHFSDETDSQQRRFNGSDMATLRLFFNAINQENLRLEQQFIIMIFDDVRKQKTGRDSSFIKLCHDADMGPQITAMILRVGLPPNLDITENVIVKFLDQALLPQIKKLDQLTQQQISNLLRYFDANQLISIVLHYVRRAQSMDQAACLDNTARNLFIHFLHQHSVSLLTREQLIIALSRWSSQDFESNQALIRNPSYGYLIRWCMLCREDITNQLLLNSSLTQYLCFHDFTALSPEQIASLTMTTRIHFIAELSLEQSIQLPMMSLIALMNNIDRQTLAAMLLRKKLTDTELIIYFGKFPNEILDYLISNNLPKQSAILLRELDSGCWSSQRPKWINDHSIHRLIQFLILHGHQIDPLDPPLKLTKNALVAEYFLAEWPKPQLLGIFVRSSFLDSLNAEAIGTAFKLIFHHAQLLKQLNTQQIDSVLKIAATKNLQPTQLLQAVHSLSSKSQRQNDIYDLAKSNLLKSLVTYLANYSAHPNQSAQEAITELAHQVCSRFKNNPTVLLPFLNTYNYANMHSLTRLAIANGITRDLTTLRSLLTSPEPIANTTFQYIVYKMSHMPTLTKAKQQSYQNEARRLLYKDAVVGAEIARRFSDEILTSRLTKKSQTILCPILQPIRRREYWKWEALSLAMKIVFCLIVIVTFGYFRPDLACKQQEQLYEDQVAKDEQAKKQQWVKQYVKTLRNDSTRCVPTKSGLALNTSSKVSGPDITHPLPPSLQLR